MVGKRGSRVDAQVSGIMSSIYGRPDAKQVIVERVNRKRTKESIRIEMEAESGFVNDTAQPILYSPALCPHVLQVL